MASLADLIRSQSAAAQRQGMSHQDSSSQMDPGMERYLAGQESATRGVPLEAPMIAPDDLIGSGLLKGLLSGAALMGGIKSVGKKVAREAPQAEALRLAQQRAALPVEQYGLGLPANNTPQMRADAMEFDRPSFHATDRDFLQADPQQGKWLKAIFTADDPNAAATFIGPNKGGAMDSIEGANIIPLLENRTGYVHLGPDRVNLTNVRNTINNGDGITTDHGYAMHVNPDNIRSRFAAFDPWRRNAAIASAMGVAAPDLLAAENPDSTRSLKDLIPK